MNVKTYRAKSVQDALQMVRAELGPDASVLQTRELPGGLWRWLPGMSRIEVTASAGVSVPSRFTPAANDESFLDRELAGIAEKYDIGPTRPAELGDSQNYRARFSRELTHDASQARSLVESLSTPAATPGSQVPATLVGLYAELLELDFNETQARACIDLLREAEPDRKWDDVAAAKTRLAALFAQSIRVAGPIQVSSNQRRLVALVGPTGVGKTTTIAKLAANYHLREQRRVGLITVDTYRIAAVDQLKTYADIIDLPMEVVATPKEMREAISRLSDLELILMDTAGRSPRDDVRLQELKSMLAEARADEVHLVLSSTASAATLNRTIQQFQKVGPTAMVLTKLDEVVELGNLMALVDQTDLPFSYLTDGQNVPDDIRAADAGSLARTMMGIPCDA